MQAQSLVAHPVQHCMVICGALPEVSKHLRNFLTKAFQNTEHNHNIRRDDFTKSLNQDFFPSHRKEILFPSLYGFPNFIVKKTPIPTFYARGKKGVI